MAIVKTRIILLRKTKINEADLILNAISKEHGKVSCLARGALRSKKRFGGGILEPSHVLEAIFPRLHHDRLSTLAEAKLIYDFPRLKLSYEKLQIAFEILAIYNRTLQENDISAIELYDLLGNSLRSLETLADVIVDPKSDRASAYEKFFVHFAVKFLALQGVLEFEDWQSGFLRESLLNHESVSAIDLARGQVEVLRLTLSQLGKH